MNCQLATLCYIENNGKTLMLERVKKINDVHQGKFNGLGGKLEDGESPEQCAIREVKEESGLTISSPKLVGLLTFPKFIGEQHWYVYVFKATSFSGSLIESAEGNLSWQETKTLHQLPLWQGDRYFLRWMQQDRFFIGRFFYEEKMLRGFEVSFPESLA